MHCPNALLTLTFGTLLCPPYRDNIMIYELLEDKGQPGRNSHQYIL